MKTLWILIALPVLIGCEGEETSDPSPAEIRIENVSDFDYENVQVDPGTESFNFGDIPSGAFSDYHTYEEGAYRYGYVEVLIDNNTFVLQPIDYVGESFLPAGKYTYQIGIPDTIGWPYGLTDLLVED